MYEPGSGREYRCPPGLGPGCAPFTSPQNNYVSLARSYDASTNEIQYLVCKDLSTSNCDAASEFTKWNGNAGYDTIATGVDSTSYPTLATTWASDGDLWIAYAKDVDGTTRAIYARFLDFPGTGWGNNETVDSSANIQFCRPSIGVDSGSNVYAMYSDKTNQLVYIKMRSGGSWGSRTQVGTNAVYPALMVRTPNQAGYGTNPSAVYYENNSKETYHYVIPEFSAVMIPVSFMLILLTLRKRRTLRKRCPDIYKLNYI